MIIRGINHEDFINYKKPSMFIIFPYCDFKCEREQCIKCCQNSSLTNAPIMTIAAENIVQSYIDNPISKAIVMGGLEPFYNWDELRKLILAFRNKTSDDIVIYTGYKEEELTEQIEWLKFYSNIIVKFGRFIPNQEKHYDEVLGVYLASPNQYAKKFDIERKI